MRRGNALRRAIVAAFALTSRPSRGRGGAINSRAGFQPDRARPLSHDRRRLRRLPYAAGRRAVRRRAADRNAVRQRCSPPISRRIREPASALGATTSSSRALTARHAPRRRATLSGDAVSRTTRRVGARMCSPSAPISTTVPAVHNAGRGQPAAVPVQYSRGRWPRGTRLSSRREHFEPVAGKGDTWNRGAYLAEGLTHCGACHTPKNLAGRGQESTSVSGIRVARMVRAGHHQRQAPRPRLLVGRRHRRLPEDRA